MKTFSTQKPITADIYHRDPVQYLFQRLQKWPIWLGASRWKQASGLVNKSNNQSHSFDFSTTRQTRSKDSFFCNHTDVCNHEQCTNVWLLAKLVCWLVAIKNVQILNFPWKSSKHGSITMAVVLRPEWHWKLEEELAQALCTGSATNCFTSQKNISCKQGHKSRAFF